MFTNQIAFYKIISYKLYSYLSQFHVLFIIFLFSSALVPKIEYEIYETFWTSLRFYQVFLSDSCFNWRWSCSKLSSKTLYLISPKSFYLFPFSICARYDLPITLKLNISKFLSQFDNAICQMDDLRQSDVCNLSRFTSFLFRQWKISAIYFIIYSEV